MGEGDDVVLCLHGWPQHWYEWRALMPALADRHRVIALDQRGFGWSEAPASGYEKEELASDVLALLDELGLERVKLVGHDWGGWIGFLLCLRAPERFERYLALNILPPWVSVRAMVPQLWRFWYQWMILAPGLGYRLHTSGQFVPKVLVGGSEQKQVWDPATIHAFSDTYREPARAHAAVQMYRIFNLRETPEIIAGRYAEARLEVPTRHAVRHRRRGAATGDAGRLATARAADGAGVGRGKWPLHRRRGTRARGRTGPRLLRLSPEIAGVGDRGASLPKRSAFGSA